MKATIKKSLQDKKQTFEDLAEIISGIDYKKILLPEKQCLRNLLRTNKKLLKSNNINSLILF